VKFITEYKINGKKLSLVQGDITERDMDAIVNAANSHLRHGGGVAGAIVRKGGQIIQDESDSIGYTPVGTAVITGAGKLTARFVIHTVGLASEKGLKSISMPAISSGIFGFPKDRCAKILVNESADYLRKNPQSSLEIIEFCVYDDNTMEHFKREFERLK